MKRERRNNFEDNLFDKDIKINSFVLFLLCIGLLFALITNIFRNLGSISFKRKDSKKMKLHTLKIEKQYYKQVMFENKKAELRYNDRNYKVGDLIHFVSTKGKDFKNSENNLFIITHILEGCENYGLDRRYCILSIQKIYTSCIVG